MASCSTVDRTFTDDDGEPLVAGFHAVGDAHTCTNPLYGRGCSLAMVQAQVLADAVAERPDDGGGAGPTRRRGTEIHPWYRAAVAQDEMNRQARRATCRRGRQSPTEAAPTAAEENPVRR